MKTLLLALLRGYKKWISPLLPPACRYLPTCSEYAQEALIRHGVVRGSWLTTRRICRCHPWGGHGHDPVPGAEAVAGAPTSGASPAPPPPSSAARP